MQSAAARGRLAGVTLIVHLLVALILAWMAPAPVAARAVHGSGDDSTAGALSGKKVKSATPARRRIVLRGLDGELVELQDKAKVVAALRLDLDASERTALEAVAAQRNKLRPLVIGMKHAAGASPPAQAQPRG